MRMRAGLGILVAVFVFAALAGLSAGAGEKKIGYKYQWDSEISYPQLDHPRIDDQILTWLQQTMQGYLPNTVEPNPDFPDDGFTMSADYRITRPSEGAVSIAFTTSVYSKGAAHPLTFVHVINCSLPDGEPLTLDRLFRDPDKALEIFADKAPGLINASLRADHPESLEQDLGDDDWFKEGFEPRPENYADLGLEPEGVRVYFQQYQVLPYVFGISDPLFTLDMLEAAGPNEEVWPKR